MHPQRGRAGSTNDLDTAIPDVDEHSGCTLDRFEPVGSVDSVYVPGVGVRSPTARKVGDFVEFIGEPIQASQAHAAERVAEVALVMVHFAATECLLSSFPNCQRNATFGSSCYTCAVGRESLSDQLAKMPHYHVVTQSDGSYLDYSDGLTEPGALGYANDLISPTSGERLQGLEVVWIAQVDPRWCQLAHGDDREKYSQDALEFLQRLIRDEPYWSAFG